MARVTKKEKMFVAVVSILIAVIQLATFVANALFFRSPLIFTSDQLLFLALILAIFPPSIVNYLDMRWRMSVDKNIPEFLRELSEAGRTGVTLTRALDLASKRRYGPLSSELKRVVSKLSWGANFEETLKSFADRVETRLARRTAILLTEVNRSGGDIREVLEVISKHMRELQTIEEERRSELRTYVGIVYVAFFIFLFIDYVLLKTFFARIEDMKTAVTEGGGMFSMQELDVKTVTSIMFHMSVIQGIFGGLVAGKMGEGALGAGMKHCLLMIVIAFLAFTFIM
ncbi:MAG: type II secretion system F family protein [Candidatus Bathyarchaeota archaeon]|nr:type II secretion system F family protein [Candidatus Bathyarchaeota archaeon]